MDKLRGNIVVSRRVLLEESRKADRSKLLSDINEGDKLKGTVKNITDYGVFVDLVNGRLNPLRIYRGRELTTHLKCSILPRH